jgi:hypothetical protein
MNLTSEPQQLPQEREPAPSGGASWRGIAIIAVAAFAAELAVSARYGYVRD